jgi:hypothetical protein
VDSLYSFLKSNDYNYIIEPLNVEDIKQLIRLSTNILEYVIFYIPAKDNILLLDSVIKNVESQDLYVKIKKLMEEYNKILQYYQDKSKEYHKSLKNFESNLKLYDK